MNVQNKIQPNVSMFLYSFLVFLSPAVAFSSMSFSLSLSLGCHIHTTSLKNSTSNGRFSKKCTFQMHYKRHKSFEYLNIGQMNDIDTHIPFGLVFCFEFDCLPAPASAVGVRYVCYFYIRSSVSPSILSKHVLPW